MMETMLWCVIITLFFLWFRNRVRHALYQKQKEDLWREVIKRAEQKKKIDALYGRGQSDD